MGRNVVYRDLTWCNGAYRRCPFVAPAKVMRLNGLKRPKAVARNLAVSRQKWTKLSSDEMTVTRQISHYNEQSGQLSLAAIFFRHLHRFY